MEAVQDPDSDYDPRETVSNFLVINILKELKIIDCGHYIFLQASNSYL